jgi:hypothetical protein
MIIGLFILITLQISAQTGKVNFSGNWVLNETKSNFGDSQFRMAATLLIINHQDNILTDDRTQPGFDGGEVKTTEKLTLDGKECENTGMMDAKRKSVVTWSEDKKSITIASTIVFNMNGDVMEMKASETWKLGEDGKSLLMETLFASPDGDIKTSLVYDKK